MMALNMFSPVGNAWQPGQLSSGAAMPRPVLNRVRQFITANPQALTQLGAGLLSGNSWQEGVANGLQGLTAGRELDKRTAEEKALDEARTAWLQGPEAMAMEPETRNLIGADPALFNEVFGNTLTAPPTTDDITEFQYAVRNGYAGTFPQWFQDSSSGGQTINVGDRFPTPPSGYDYRRDAQGDPIIDMETGTGTYVQVPGGPDANAAATAEHVADVNTQSLVTNINTAIDLAADWGATGLPGTIAGALPLPSSSRNLENELSAIKNRVSINELQTMRQTSPTGAAMGNVSNQDMQRVEGAYVKLDQAAGGPALVAALEELRTVTLDIAHGQGNWSLGDDGSVEIGPGAGAAAAPSAPAAGGQIIINDATGERMRLNPATNQWEPI